VRWGGEDGGVGCARAPCLRRAHRAANALEGEAATPESLLPKHSTWRAAQPHAFCGITRNVIACCMVQSFKCKNTQALYEGRSPRGFKAFVAVAERKLAQLDAAQTLDFLKAPPGNRLEALKGDRKGQLSIRINDQWRVCFVRSGVGPVDVEIVDYH
jgi:toxin HigB-1